MNEKLKVGTEPYKGVRDFYPEDMAVLNYIFSVWRKTVEKAGYQEYGASPLEYAELYRSKGSDEIVNEQMYVFKDKGDREVALRPEMTPTLARMIASRRRGLKLPLRWFSIPNVFRYEKPQRGRKREHFQLNCDLMGYVDKDPAKTDTELVSLAYKIMKAFGAKDEDFEIKINHRAYFPYLFKELGFNLSPEEVTSMTRLIDRKNKMELQDFNLEADKILARHGGVEKYTNGITQRGKELRDKFFDESGLNEILNSLPNVKPDSDIARGFDYYSGMVFEVFDTNPENRRSLFGGGRYDNLLEIFGVEPLPTVGFGMGDVTIRDFLETHDLLPPELKQK